MKNFKKEVTNIVILFNKDPLSSLFTRMVMKIDKLPDGFQGLKFVSFASTFKLAKSEI